MVRIRKKSYKIHEIKKILRKISKDFEFTEGRGKGSHIYVYHPKGPKGVPIATTISCHGKNHELGPSTIERLIEIFGIPIGKL